MSSFFLFYTMKNHVMIDLETLGIKTDAIVLEIGAVVFDITTGEIGNKFNATIDMQSSIDAGRTIDSPTLNWWMSQPIEIREIVFSGETPFSLALDRFYNWFPEGAYVWGNGPSFDISKLESAYEALNGPESYPWKFYNVRCVRTIRDLTKDVIDRNDIKIHGFKHTALADAIWQAKYVSKMYQVLKKGINT